MVLHGHAIGVKAILHEGTDQADPIQNRHREIDHAKAGLLDDVDAVEGQHAKHEDTDSVDGALEDFPSARMLLGKRLSKTLTQEAREEAEDDPHRDADHKSSEQMVEVGHD